LQGVILGVGLSMLEHLFSEQIQELPEGKDHKARSSKRRKTDSTPDLDDDDTVYYASVQGGKKRGGTGYAGDQKEDVSSNTVYTHATYSMPIDFRANRSTSYSAGQG